MSNDCLCETVVVQNEKGLHLRPAELVAKAAMKYQSTVLLSKDDQSADCKNMLSILTLGAVQGTELELSAEGPDAADALAALAELFNTGFQELETSDSD